MTIRETIALARLATRVGQISKAGPRQSVGVRKDAPIPTPQRSGFVRVQRPDTHPQPIVAQLTGAGKHGITVREASGQVTTVRHAHVLDTDAKLTAKERAQFHQSLHAHGVPVDPSHVFLTGNARRPTKSQLGLLQALTAQGVPVDLAAVHELATYDDAQHLLEHYVRDPDGTIASRSDKDMIASLGYDDDWDDDANHD